jgi:hypothetical protein
MLVLYFVSYLDGVNVAFAALTIVIALMLIALVAAVLIMERAGRIPKKRKIGTTPCEMRAQKAIADGGARPPTSAMGLGCVKTLSHGHFRAATWAKLRSAVILPSFLSFPSGNGPDAGGGRLGRLCGMISARSGDYARIAARSG